MEKLTREQVIAKIKERKAIAENKKRLEERKAKLVEQRRSVARRPLTETNRRPAARPVIVENRPKVARQETLLENINKRNRGLKLNKAQSEVYSVLAQNIFNANKALNEATQAHPIAGLNNQAGVGMVQTFFDIFYGYFPNLVAPLLASTQPMKTENGYIFYMQYTAGDNKGHVAKGDVLIDPFKVNTPKEYTSDKVYFGKINAAAAAEKTVAKWAPVKARSIKVKGLDVTWTSDSTFVADDVTWLITETDATIKLSTAATTTKAYEFEYEYNNAYAPAQVPEIHTNVEKIGVSAKYRTVKTNYAFTAAFGFEAEHGANLGDHLAEVAMFELKREIDLEVIEKIMLSAPETVIWNKSAGFAVGGYNDHKLTFLDAIVEAANRIFSKSKRVRGNVLLASIEALNVIETLPFYDGKETGDQLEGAGVVGHIKKMPVIAIPELAANEWAVIYKSKDNNLDAGLVFAPYIPVFATEPVTLDDLQIRRAFITAYALEVVNADYFVRGRIVNDPVALPIYIITKDGGILAEGGVATAGELDEDAVLNIFG